LSHNFGYGLAELHSLSAVDTVLKVKRQKLIYLDN
jgi:hypothetical protein